MSERLDTTRLQRMARAYAESAVLWAALDLALFRHVADGAGTIDELAAATGIRPLNARRLVDCCAGLDLLRYDDGGRIVNSPEAAQFLVEGDDRFAGPWMQFTRPDVEGWMSLTERLRSPEPPQRLGMYADLTVEQARSYHRATASIGRGAGRRFVRQVDLGRRTRLLDLGGGSGPYAIEAALAHPGLRAVVFDLPPVAVVCREYLAAAGVADRVEAVGGDFTADPLPDGCDVAVMASNLPIYSADVIGEVVARAFDALVPGGEFHLIGEMLHDDGMGPLDAALWGMQEILYGSGGQAHRRAQVIGYLAAAGFRDVTAHDFVPGVLVRVTGMKPG
ncbi:MAG: methyltransferase [Desertimonas sp.]